MNNFNKINLASSVLIDEEEKWRDILIGIWMEKCVYFDVLTRMDEMGFEYIENISWIKLDEKKFEGKETEEDLAHAIYSSSDKVFKSAWE